MPAHGDVRGANRDAGSESRRHPTKDESGSNIRVKRLNPYFGARPYHSTLNADAFRTTVMSRKELIGNY